MAVTIEELEKKVDKLTSWNGQTSSLRQSEVALGGSVGVLAWHAERMGLVYHIDAEGQFIGLEACWVDAFRNGYTEQEVGRLCSAVCRMLRGARERA